MYCAGNSGNDTILFFPHAASGNCDSLSSSSASTAATGGDKDSHSSPASRQVRWSLLNNSHFPKKSRFLPAAKPAGHRAVRVVVVVVVAVKDKGQLFFLHKAKLNFYFLSFSPTLNLHRVGIHPLVSLLGINQDLLPICH